MFLTNKRFKKNAGYCFSKILADFWFYNLKRCDKLEKIKIFKRWLLVSVRDLCVKKCFYTSVKFFMPASGDCLLHESPIIILILYGNGTYTFNTRQLIGMSQYWIEHART